MKPVRTQKSGEVMDRLKFRDATPNDVAREANRLLMEMRDRPGYIFNLGHGVTPAARLENIAALVETVRSFK